MKHKIILHFFIIFFLLFLTFLVFFCFFFKSPEFKIQENNSSDSKIILKLGHKVDNNNFEILSQTKEIKRLNIYLKETKLQNYENQKDILPIIESLESEFNILIDQNWKYYIHFYDEEEKNGFIEFTYWIQDEIETTRTILLPI